jgi:multidrug efflux pump subunit AcrA (membrane-fusion protein)
MKAITDFTGSSRQLAPSLKLYWRSGRTTGVLLMTTLILSNCGGESKAEKEKAAPPPVPVVVTPVIQKTVPIFSEFTAQADARDTVELRARVEAFLEKIHFEEGRPVKSPRPRQTSNSPRKRSR